MSFTADHLYQVLSGWPAPSRYRVALSGGLDSTVLLHALASLRQRLAAPVSAIHIDHGLQDDSPAWSAHCRALCAGLDIPLDDLAVDVPLQHRPGQSLEAVARDMRYDALAGFMQPGDMLLTAQHRDDQAETVLLQLLRGAGVAGLAAMPELAEFASGLHGRPLLGFDRAELETYARAQGLAWLEDPSNASLEFDRNYLRHEILPRLKARWPAAATTLSRSAAHCAAADRVLTGLARQDLRQCRLSSHSLAIPPLQLLPVDQQYNLLRTWIDQAGLPLPPARKLDRILSEVIPAREDAQPLVAWEGAELRRYRDVLWLMPPLPPVPEDWQAGWDGQSPLALPEGLGVLRGAAPASGELQVAFRRDGLSCTPAGRQGSRSLKKLFQELGVPPWVRERTPLLLIGGELAAVGDYCVCTPFEDVGSEVAIVWERAGWLGGTDGDADEEE